LIEKQLLGQIGDGEQIHFAFPERVRLAQNLF
jgi:hypothetical protein